MSEGVERCRINKCCSCCTVRTGSLIIGVIGLIGSLWQAITSSTSTEISKISNTTADDDYAIVFLEKNRIPNTVTTLNSIFMIFLNAFLVIGVCKNNQKFILPWLVIEFLYCFAFTVAIFIFFFLTFASHNAGVLLILLLIIVGLTALAWYCWICVWSFYMDLGEGTTTIVPAANSYPMTEPMQVQVELPPPYSAIQETMVMKTTTNPPQEMV